MKTLTHKALKLIISIKFLVISILICVSSLSFADETSWREEYNDICGKTNEAVSLSKVDVASLIDRCNTLLETIKETDNPRKKIFLFRFEKCRNFYQYLYDLKKDGGQG